jgi:hypothetical protein
MRLLNLPEDYPMSFVYDLVDFVGGSAADIEEAHDVGGDCAKLHVYKNTALKMIK